MMDQNINYADIAALANVTTPPAIVETVKPSWLDNKPMLKASIEKSIKDSENFKSANPHIYKEKGPLGIPALTYERGLDYLASYTDLGKRETLAQDLFLPSTACYMLDFEAKKSGAWGPECKISKIIKRPRGKLVISAPTGERADNSMYTPPGNGKRATTDSVRFILENGEGKKVDVTIKINIGAYESDRGSLTPDTKLASNSWSTEPQDLLDLSDATFDFAPSAYSKPFAWSTVLNAAVRSVSIITNLPGAAVGETVGTGNAATITLDTNAAGHSWFIDATPSDNSEYLPTSDANVWIAKAGSTAEGKMDMLSVLLHEYGHALGFEHSDDTSDFMSASLVAGERRLPTADELTLMSQLIAKLKGSDGTTSPSSPSAPSSPFDPSAPLGGSLGLLALGRLRRNDYGGWELALDSVKTIVPQASTQYQAQYQAAQHEAATTA